MSTDEERAEQFADRLVADGALDQLLAAKERVKDLLESEFGYATTEGEAQIFMVVCMLYSEHAAQLSPAGDRPRIQQVEKMIACVRKNNAERDHAH